MCQKNAKATALAIELARLAHDHKSQDVVVMDLRGISSVTDFVVICTGTSARQMRAVADRAIEYGKRIGEKPFGINGYDAGTWVLVDFIDVVLHVFAKPHREYYDLELLWGDAERLKWSDDSE